MKTLLDAVKKHLPKVIVLRKETSNLRIGNRIVAAYYLPKEKAIILSKNTNVYITDVLIFVHEVGHALFATWNIEEDNLVEELIVRRFVSLVLGLSPETANDYLTLFWNGYKKAYLISDDPDFQKIVDGSDALWRMDLAQELTELVKSRSDIGI